MLSKNIRQMQQHRALMLAENTELNNQLKDMKAHIDLFKVPKGYKKFHQLKSPTAKARRKAQFKRCLNQSMIHLHEIRFAQVKLTIGDKGLDFTWCQDDLRELRSNATNILPNGLIPPNPNHVNNNSPPLNGNEDNEEFEDAPDDFPDAFSPNGSWNRIHVQKVIHVLDLYQISHKAYHDLRSTSHSILPPLNTVKREKQLMSKDINYYTNGMVIIFVKSNPKFLHLLENQSFTSFS